MKKNIIKSKNQKEKKVGEKQIEKKRIIATQQKQSQNQSVKTVNKGILRIFLAILTLVILVGALIVIIDYKTATGKTTTDQQIISTQPNLNLEAQGTTLFKWDGSKYSLSQTNTLFPGDKVLFGLKIKNSGADMTKPVDVSFELNRIDGKSTFTNPVKKTLNLKSGQIDYLTAHSENSFFTIVQKGDNDVSDKRVLKQESHNVVIIFDSAKVLSTDSKVLESKIGSSPPSNPDLIVEDIKFFAENKEFSGKTSKTNIDFEALIFNIGMEKASKNNAVLKISGAKDAIIDLAIPEIDGGSKTLLKSSIKIEEGINSITLKIDNNNSVDEANEGNNEVSKIVKVVSVDEDKCFNSGGSWSDSTCSCPSNKRIVDGECRFTAKKFELNNVVYTADVDGSRNLITFESASGRVLVPFDNESLTGIWRHHGKNYIISLNPALSKITIREDTGKWVLIVSGSNNDELLLASKVLRKKGSELKDFKYCISGSIDDFKIESKEC